jgi:S-adenosylmethionine synthetase
MIINKVSAMPDRLQVSESITINGSIPFSIRFETFGKKEKKQKNFAKLLAKYYGMELQHTKVTNTFKFIPR